MIIDKDMIIGAGRYLIDGVLLTVVWAKTPFTLLTTNALWTESFGQYADAIKISIQVIITLLVAVTAVYRMLREIHKYRDARNKKNEEKQ